MLDFIDKLRSKPRAVRTRIAFFTSAAVTLVIFGSWAAVWNFNLSHNLSKKSGAASAAGIASYALDSNADSKSVDEKSKTDVDPLVAFGEVFSNGWSSLVKSLGQIKGTAKDNFASTTDVLIVK